MEEKEKLNGEGIFDAAIRQIELRQERAASGYTNCIPLPFKRTSRFHPGVEKGTYDIITASSGVSKSKFTRFLYVMNSYEFIKENPETDIRLKIFFFSLEEDKEKFMMSIISYWLYIKHRKRVSIKELRSIGEVGTYLPQDILNLVKEGKEYFKDLEKYVTIIDSVKNPTGIFKIMKDYNERKGHWTYKEIEIDGKLQNVKNTFIPNDPQLYIMCIIDHISLLHTEKQDGQMLNLHQTIGLWSSRYAIELRNKYDNIIVVVQQQSADVEKKQFTFKGQSIDEKVYPSLSGLGDNKLTQRDADNVFGLFAPDRYQIEECEGYDITKLQDHYRLLLKLKGRDGESNIRTSLYFDGACNVFKELPPPNDPEMINVYNRVKEIYNN